MRRAAFSMLMVWAVCAVLVSGACVVGSLMKNRMLVFSLENEDRTRQNIVVADIERGLTVQIPFSSHWGFALSPNGMFAIMTEDLKVITFDSYGENRQTLIESGDYELDYLEAEWSPDGTALAFVYGASSSGSQEQIYLWQQGTVRNLMPNDSLDSIFHIKWSSDGTRLAFLGYPRGSTPSGIYTLDVNSNRLHRVSSFEMSADRPTWSPDGNYLAYVGRVSNMGDIYVVDAEGGSIRNLTNTSTLNEVFPAWSPDGTQIAFNGGEAGTFEIYVMNTDGSGIHQLLDYRNTESRPVWSPDGLYIAFSSPRRGDGVWEIHVMRADGSEPHLVSYNDERRWAEDAVWLP